MPEVSVYTEEFCCANTDENERMTKTIIKFFIWLQFIGSKLENMNYRFT